ncbi:ATP-dependent DNA helicase RecG [Leifsonia sp. Leaf264]|uniref:ATP-dependent DNA helicase RecG n=1 Tax=Leifsonia sp. Leaf264 TaxID=1736314 RepID=UPI0006FA086B|nr:ATP-dependent DNA helicase RecG [Leifsonia sp. Leaf264]KQP01326.1 ATP-dependent DNA helicase RecG [Leifsonia sp. Leaf264]
MTSTDASPGADSLSTSPLDAPLATVLAPRTATPLAKAFGIRTVGDLLSHYPRRYARRGELTALDRLPLDENVTIVAEVREVRGRSMKNRRGHILEVSISDGAGILTLTYFNQGWREKELRPGVRGVFAGKVTAYRSALQLAHPDYELFDDDSVALSGAADPDAGKRWSEMPIPIYPATGSLSSWNIAKAIATTLDGLRGVGDAVPAAVREEQGLLAHARALELVHRPQTDSDWRRARDSLRFAEAFVLQAALLQERAIHRASATTARVPRPGGYLERFDGILPFILTADQEEVGDEIAGDIAATAPMNRLVQGEVGSGKTLVALRAMLAVAETGGQSALLAPTEVLAAQHLRSIARTLGPDLSAELMPTLITGQLSAAERRKALLRAVSGQARIVVGTHALLGETVSFYDLGLVVIDEQHRFGVDQREALRLKGATPPHVLVLTATPIPRTVAMTVFGDLDVSVIRELPAGRSGIESFVVPLAEKPGWWNRVWTRMAEELALGRQGFVVCPAIDAKQPEEGEELGDDETPAPLASVGTTLEALRAHPDLAGRRIEALHGRMSSEEKDAVMQAFAAGRIDVLVATTVIEVGVDVPNASTMVVLDAERFGVSQLHQLRGRVGRGSVPGLCLLVTNAAEESLGRQRVDAVAATLDGFELAQADLELRREGDVLGGLQSGGRSSLRLLRVAKDGDIIADARRAVQGILDVDPAFADHPDLREAVARRLDESEREYLNKA